MSNNSGRYSMKLEILMHVSRNSTKAKFNWSFRPACHKHSKLHSAEIFDLLQELQKCQDTILMATFIQCINHHHNEYR